jgi:hypothetical protein
MGTRHLEILSRIFTMAVDSFLATSNPCSRVKKLGKSRWSSINFDSKSIDVTDTKNSEDRSIPMNENLVNLFSKLMEKKIGDFV